MDEGIVKLFDEAAISKEIKLTFLELLAFLDKEKKEMSTAVKAAAAKCALTCFSGDLNEPIPAIVLYVLSCSRI